MRVSSTLWPKPSTVSSRIRKKRWNTRKKYDQTLNTAASLRAAQKVNLATLELEQLPNYDPADPGRAAAPDPQKFKAMIALLGEVGALDRKVDLNSLDQSGLEKIARPWKSLHAPASAAE